MRFGDDLPATGAPDVMLSFGKFKAAAAVAGCWLVAQAAGALPEYNPVREEPRALGPEAHRLIVGFRAAETSESVKTVIRAGARSHTVVQAQTSAVDAASAAQRAGIVVSRTRQFTPSMHVLFLPKTLYGADVAAALTKLRADPQVKFAEVDELRHPHAGLTPNDPLYAPSSTASGQWYMNMPSTVPVVLNGVTTQDLSATDAISAWQLSTGSRGVVIADVDTGVRFEHPDLLRAGSGGRLLPGYDFVGQDYDPNDGDPLGTFLIANDGDGWDPDPSDPGDWINSADMAKALFKNDTAEASSWHGTRVIGIFGAVTDNDVGIAAMSWNSWALPVRALGKGGGYDSDIIAGIEWAAGLPVVNPDGPPVPPNPYPADIVNLSLGGTGSCPSSYEDALEQVTELGVLVVASAGNGGTPGTTAPVETPANCSTLVPGVIAVVGLRNVGTKVGYSSFGAEATIAAPAGNCVISTGGACLRSIDTTTNLGTTGPGASSYTNETNDNLGTSFSAPIVSGIAALMRSVNGNLTPAQLVTRLRLSATPFPQTAADEVTVPPTCPSNDMTSGECVCPNIGAGNGNQCGAGMVNALSAVKAAQKPIGVVVIPAAVKDGSVFDASASVAGCNASLATPAPLTIKSYAWTASPASLIVAGANSSKVTVNPAPGTLTLTVTDSEGNADVESVTLTANSAVSAAPTTAGTSATACPAALVVSPAAPKVTEGFSPAYVGEKVASTLTITFENSNGFVLTSSSFSLTLPSNLTVAASPAPQTSCTGSMLSLTNTLNSVTLRAADIPANGNCTVTLSVQSASAGKYTTAIAAQALMTAPAGGNTASASAVLSVSAPTTGGGGGGGSLDWLDLLFVAGVILTLRGHAIRRLRK